MLPSERTHTIVDNTTPDNPKEIKFESDITDFPTATYLDVFNIYPDPHSGPLQYITERYITSTEDAIETYSNLINDTNNKSPLKHIAPLLNLNPNSADFRDSAAIRFQIPQYAADRMRQTDFFWKNRSDASTNMTSSGMTHDDDAQANLGKCEVRLYTDLHHKVLFLNNYPVYIGINPLGFINYVVKATNTQNTKL